MKMRSFIIQQVAKLISKNELKKHAKAVDIQLDILNDLIKNSMSTHFGEDHGFTNISDYSSFKKHVDIFNYESLLPYIEKIKQGKKDVLWPGKPIYFAKTSGTTSGAKFIPITKASIGHHIAAARNALFFYVSETNNASFFTQQMIFLQGSPVLEEANGIKIGRLSGIVYHHVPKWLLKNRLPSYASNCIENWEDKIEAIVNETANAKMSLFSGIPPWCVDYFQKLLDENKYKNLKEQFPQLQLYVYGGLNYAPYQKKMQELLGDNVDTIETYPASEGFFAYQDSQSEDGLLLNIDAGIFYEFVKVDEFHNDNPKRLYLGEIELGLNYVLIVSTNAGLWAYNTGDTIRFVSKNPYRIVVTGRLKHFISAFGEHVIQEEVEKAIVSAEKFNDCKVVEFTVAPFISEKASYHEWFIEFEKAPNDIAVFMKTLDETLQGLNIYYKDLRNSNLLKQAKCVVIEKNGFTNYFKDKGKLGGQNKVQHLANDRKVVDALKSYVKKG